MPSALVSALTTDGCPVCLEVGLRSFRIDPGGDSGARSTLRYGRPRSTVRHTSGWAECYSLRDELSSLWGRIDYARARVGLPPLQAVPASRGSCASGLL